MENVVLGNVESIAGNVTVIHKDGSSEPLTLDAQVYIDDVISTGKNAHVQVQLLDGSVLKLDAGQTAVLNADLVGAAGGHTVTTDDGAGLVTVSNIGVITSVQGNVQVIRDGQTLTLRAGDALLAGDVLKTGPDAAASLRMLDGSRMDIGPDFQANLNDQLFSSRYERFLDQGLEDPAVIQAAILAGQDPSKDLQAPGAGASGNEGGEAIIISPSGRAVTPESGHDTHGQEQPFRVSDEELLQNPVDSEPTLTVVQGGDGTVDEAALADGSNASSPNETTTGTFAIDTGNDSLKSLVIDGEDVTSGGTVTGSYGLLTVTLLNGEYSWSYTLGDNTTEHTSQGTGIDGVQDDFSVVVTDQDDDTALDTLSLEIRDDVPSAVSDAAGTGEDQTLTYNVITNADGTGDVAGADGPVTLTSVTLVSGSGTLEGFTAAGEITVTPDNGYEGDLVLGYTITDADGDTSESSLTITVSGDSEPTLTVVQGGDGTVDEAALADGSNASSPNETTTGTFAIDTGNDSLKSLVIDGVDVTSGGTVTGSYGLLTVTLLNGEYSWSYTLGDNTTEHTSQGTGIDGVQDDFSVVVTDQDDDTALDTLSLEIRDDVPSAVSDAAGTGEDQTLTYNVITNADGTGDVAGADGPVTLTSVTLVSGSGTLEGFTAAGEITVTPDNGYEGDLVLGYTITDADGDTSESSLTITVSGDSEPTLTVVQGGDGTVDEAALADGSNASSPNETTTGTFAIDTGNDSLKSLVIDGEDVTSGGTVTGSYGLLTVTLLNGEYSWSYTLGDNTTEHTSQGTGIDGVQDDFSVVVTDQDDDTALDTLSLEIRDDVPSAVSDAAGTGEDQTLTYNVITNADGTGDVAGADGPVTLTSVTLVSGSGTLEGFTAAGEITVTPDNGYEGDLVLGYTITDADGDTSESSLTITVSGDSEPTLTVVQGGDGTVDEAALADGSNASSPNETTTGTFAIDTGNDSLKSLVIDGEDVTSGGTVTGSYGLLTVTLLNGEYSWSYTLGDNTTEHTSQGTGIDGVQDDFSVVVTDQDDDTALDTLSLEIRDDVPSAVSDAAGTGEDQTLTYNVITNADGTGDVAGADGPVTLTSVTLVSGSGTLEGFTAAGEITVTPDNGYEGDLVLGYTITDADGDTSESSLTITVSGDSEPTLTVVQGGDGTVDEAALADGSNASSPNETTTGTFAIDTGNDSLKSLVIDGEDVTSGGTVTGSYGLLTVTLLNGEYSWSYTLGDNTTEHTSQGTGIDGVQDDFSVVVTDQDDDTALDTLSLEIRDDVPSAVSDAAGTGEDQTLTYNVITNADGTGDVAGADGPVTLTSVTLVSGSGTLEGFTAAGEITVTPDNGYEGDLVLGYTITDADGDTSESSLTITVSGDSEPTLTVVQGGDGTVDEAALADGSNASSPNETTTGTFAIDTGNDSLKSLVIDGEDVTSGGAVTGSYGLLTVTLLNGEYSWSYTLGDNTTEHTSQGTGIDGVQDDFSVVVTDQDDDTALDTLSLEIRDDVPSAVSDAAGTGEDQTLTYNVITNADGTGDVAGADGPVTLTSVTLVSGSGTLEGFTAAGEITVTPDNGYEGDLVLGYTITDADGDTSESSLTITVSGDSEPTLTVVQGGDGTVDEAALADGSNASSPNETTTGTFAIDTGNDSLKSLVIDGEDVTSGGAVTGSYGLLTVTLLNGEYSWSYTLGDNTTEHTSQGTGIDGVQDDFSVVVTDQDDDTALDTLSLEIRDDVPSAVSDAAGTGEDQTLTYNVITNADGTGDVAGADGPVTLTSVTLVSGSGTLEGFTAAGEITVTPDNGYEGDLVLGYTITDADGDTSESSLTITVSGDSEPTLTVVQGGDGTVDEAALADGSNASSPNETTTGTFAIDTGNDSLKSLVIDGEDVTSGGTVTGSYGLLTVTLLNGEYSWSYTLGDNTTEHTSQGTGIDGVQDDFSVVVTDQDDDTALDTLSLEIRDDVPSAVSDAAGTGEDQTLTYNVITNADGTGDVAGADGPVTLTSVTLVSGSGTLEGFTAAGEITVTPDNGYEGDLVLGYTITDADGDTSESSLTITVSGDSEPTLTVVQGGDGTVDEAALADGSNASSPNETTTGTFAIDTGNDSLKSLVIDGEDVTSGGAVTGSYGLLTVTLLNGEYSWSYTLGDNTTEHTSQGTGIDGVQDDFSVVVTDQDDDTALDTLSLEIRDDVPSAVSDAAGTGEDQTLTYNVITNADGTGDVAGADGPVTLTSVTLVSGSGTLEGFTAAGEITVTPDNGYEGDLVLGYTITDADGDTSESSLTITVSGDSEPTLTVVQGGDGTVDEAALADGSNASSPNETTTGTFAIDTGNDSLKSLVIDGEDVTSGGAVTGSYGLLTVTLLNGEYSWSYTLGDNTTEHTSQGTGIDGVQDDFSVVVTDQDDDTALDTLSLEIRDDVPSAVSDAAGTGEDQTLTYNVITNADGTGDVAGADGPVTLTSVTLVSGSGTLEGFTAAGEITVTPDNGYEGDLVLGYTITDADGDTSESSLTITVSGDSEPTLTVVQGGDGTVDEAALADGSNASSPNETTTGTFAIDTGNDSLKSLVIDGEDVTSGGAVTGSYGLLTVTLLNGEYSWSYTLGDNTTEHTSQGTGIDGVQDDFSVVVTDQDDDTALDTLSIGIRDDVLTVDTADHGVVRNHDGSAINPAVVSPTGDLGISEGADGLDSLVIEYAGAHIDGQVLNQLTSNGRPVSVSPDGDGGLVGELDDGTDIFTLTANTDGTYTFNLLQHLDVFAQQEFTLDSSSIAGGPADVLYLNTDTGIKMNVEGSSWVATVTGDGRLNPSSTGIGVGDNNFNTGDTITFDLDDEDADAAPASADLVSSLKLGFKDFTAADTGGVNWTAVWIAVAGDTTPVETTSGTFYYADGVVNSSGVLEFTVEPNNGYILDSVQITAGTDTQMKMSTVALFSSNETGTATLDFDYTATDGDGDAATGSFSVVVDGGGGTGTLIGTTGDDVISGNIQADILVGGDGDDILIGGAGNDELLGGAGNDIMSGGSGYDTFTWQADESGTDIITDFNPVEGDALNIADLLVGENNPTAEELDDSYMSISSGASTTITIFGDSGNADQVIELAGYDTTGLTGVEILNNLLAGGNLITD